MIEGETLKLLYTFEDHLQYGYNKVKSAKHKLFMKAVNSALYPNHIHDVSQLNVLRNKLVVCVAPRKEANAGTGLPRLPSHSNTYKISSRLEEHSVDSNSISNPLKKSSAVYEKINCAPVVVKDSSNGTVKKLPYHNKDKEHKNKKNSNSVCHKRKLDINKQNSSNKRRFSEMPKLENENKVTTSDIKSKMCQNFAFDDLDDELPDIQIDNLPNLNKTIDSKINQEICKKNPLCEMPKSEKENRFGPSDTKFVNCLNMEFDELDDELPNIEIDSVPNINKSNYSEINQEISCKKTPLCEMPKKENRFGPSDTKFVNCLNMEFDELDDELPNIVIDNVPNIDKPEDSKIHQEISNKKLVLSEKKNIKTSLDSSHKSNRDVYTYRRPHLPSCEDNLRLPRHRRFEFVKSTVEKIRLYDEKKILEWLPSQISWIKAVLKGEIKNTMHETYMKGWSESRNIAFPAYYGLLLKPQIETITRFLRNYLVEQLYAAFCHDQRPDHMYTWQVQVPLVATLICQEVTGLSFDHCTEIIMCVRGYGLSATDA